MTGVETEWEEVCKRLWVAALLFPSLVQCSLLRRYHHLEHLGMPFTSFICILLKELCHEIQPN